MVDSRRVIDTHCHLDSPRFDADREKVLERARAAGVADVFVPSVGPEGWRSLLEFAGSHPGVHAGLGIHPQMLPDLDPAGDEDRLADLESALGKGGAAAVGECGLDGPSRARAPMDRQLAVLRGHLALSRRFGLPLVLHCLRAHEAMLALLEREGVPAGGVMHSYSGSPELVPRYAALGLFFAVAGPVTFENARRPVAVARAIPPDRLVLETDAPDQTPRPHRGRCEPAHIVQVAAAVAAARGVALEEVDRLTSANARRLFRLASHPPP
jgi:TatD DNase family protein